MVEDLTEGINITKIEHVAFAPNSLTAIIKTSSTKIVHRRLIPGMCVRIGCFEG